MKILNDVLTYRILDALTQLDENHIVARLDDRRVTQQEVMERLSTLDELFKSVDLTNKIVSLVIACPIDYFVFDLFLIIKGAVNMTVPLEFSDEQIGNFLNSADYCIVNNDNNFRRLKDINNQVSFLSIEATLLNPGFAIERRANRTKNWCKVVHTSGTTSHPKGAIISREAVNNMISKLLVAIPLNTIHYFSFQPLSLLIEQVFALYLPLVSGGSIQFKSVELPLFGLTNVSDDLYLDSIKDADSNFYFLPPKLIENLSARATALQDEGSIAVKHFFSVTEPYFLMTGGGKVNQLATRTLAALNIPVYEGYGTSENCSVISINTPNNHHFGSVGKPLIGTEVSILNEEIIIHSDSLFEGYLHNGELIDIPTNGRFATGDIGALDKEGYLYIRGRKKNVIILSSARNICPEHVEAEYRKSKKIKEIVVFGDSMPYLTAVIYPSSNDAMAAEIKIELRATARNLPLFCLIEKFILIKPSTSNSAHFTVTQRPRREVIFNQFKDQIARLYNN